MGGGGEVVQRTNVSPAAMLLLDNTPDGSKCCSAFTSYEIEARQTRGRSNHDKRPDLITAHSSSRGCWVPKVLGGSDSGFGI